MWPALMKGRLAAAAGEVVALAVARGNRALGERVWLG